MENDGFEIKHLFDARGKLCSRPQNTAYYFHSCFSWSLISSSVAAFRYKPKGFIFDVAGMSCFAKNNLLYLLALCNSKVVMQVLSVIAPTINYQCGDIAEIPVLFSDVYTEGIENLVLDCIKYSRNDWDTFETSWNFEHHPLI